MERANQPLAAVAHASAMVNVAPSPGVLATRSAPPCASTIPLAMAKPRPTPPVEVFRACQERSKRCGSCSAVIRAWTRRPPRLDGGDCQQILDEPRGAVRRATDRGEAAARPVLFEVLGVDCDDVKRVAQIVRDDTEHLVAALPGLDRSGVELRVVECECGPISEADGNQRVDVRVTLLSRAAEKR